MFVAMPSRKDESGVFRDIVHPISPEAREMIESKILNAYERHLAIAEAEAIAVAHKQRNCRHHNLKKKRLNKL